MKRYSIILIAFLVVLGVRAGNYDSTRVAHKVEVRATASFTKHFQHNISLSISEEIRSQVYNSYNNPKYFNKSYTTLEVSYKPIKYFGISAGYTLKIQNSSDSIGSTKYKAHWSDANEFIRHRGIFALTGYYKTRFWSFSLRERLDLNGRTDSVNTLEKSKLDLRLRHRIYAVYSIPGRSLKVFGAVELINTLNQPLDYVNQELNTSYGQYLSDVRVRVGVKWRIDQSNSLNFNYRFGYGQDYDVNITKTKQYVHLDRITSFEHVFGIVYEFDW